MLLPYLMAGLGGTVVPDYQAATYMIVGQLASRATFSADLVTGGLVFLTKAGLAGCLCMPSRTSLPARHTRFPAGLLAWCDRTFSHFTCFVRVMHAGLPMMRHTRS